VKLAFSVPSGISTENHRKECILYCSKDSFDVQLFNVRQYEWQLKLATLPDAKSKM